MLVAIGAYQLQQALLAARRLEAAGHRTAVTRGHRAGPLQSTPRRTRAGLCGRRPLPCAPCSRRLPPCGHRLRTCDPEPTLGLMHRIDTGARQTRAWATARGGTLDVAGMLFANRCTWAHRRGGGRSRARCRSAELAEPPRSGPPCRRGDPRVITGLGLTLPARPTTGR
ncbi:hypothetical protein ACPA9J_03650 [Pseudomonas aeruginosa]